MVCLRGTVRVLADDDKTRSEFELATSPIGIFLSPMIWGTQYRYTAGALLLVFASHHYYAADYTRTYDEFLAELAKRGDSPGWGPDQIQLMVRRCTSGRTQDSMNKHSLANAFVAAPPHVDEIVERAKKKIRPDLEFLATAPRIRFFPSRIG